MAVVLFPGFELLDVAAPGELLGAAAASGVKLLYCAEHAGPVQSNCMERSGGSVGPAFLAPHELREGGGSGSFYSERDEFTRQYTHGLLGDLPECHIGARWQRNAWRAREYFPTLLVA